MIGIIGHRMHDDAALEAERLEDAAHILERGLRRLVERILLGRINRGIAIDVELAIAALGRRQRNRRARLAHPLRKDGLILQRHGLYLPGVWTIHPVILYTKVAALQRVGKWGDRCSRGLDMSPRAVSRARLEKGRRWSAPTQFLQFLAVLAGLICATSARAADPALIAAAQKEGQVTWYTTQITNQFGRPAMEAFQKRYGIRVNFIRGDSIELAVRMINEAQAGRLQADVFDGTSTAPPLKKAGLALAWLPERARLWPPEYRGSEEVIGSPPTSIPRARLQHQPGARGQRAANLPRICSTQMEGEDRRGPPRHLLGRARLHRRGAGRDGRGARQGLSASARPPGLIEAGGNSVLIVWIRSIAGEYPIALQVFGHQPFISAEARHRSTGSR